MALPTSDFASNNPYVDWAWGPGRPYYFLPGLQAKGDERMTLLVQIKGISAEQFVNGGFFLKNEKRRAEWQASFVIPFPGLPTLAAGENPRNWVIAFATQSISATIANSPDLKPYVVSVVLGRPLNSQSLPTPKSVPVLLSIAATAAKLARIKPTRGKPRPVFMGVIDDGIAFANARFRYMAGGKPRTRVQDWWKMASPSGGKYLDASAIDILFGLCSPNGVLDEDLFYRYAGLTDWREGDHKAAAWRVTHGTHVMDAACGYDPAENRLDRPIACVQLPNSVTAAVDNGSLIPFIVWATGFVVGSMLAYCIKQGLSLMPVVINFSYGRLEGPHDGTGDVETFIEKITAALAAAGITLRFVLPAGNSYLQRCHAQMSFTGIGDEKKWDWHVQPDDQTESFIEIWTPKYAGGASRLTLTVTDPAGNSASITETAGSVKLGSHGKLVHDNSKPGHGVFYVQLLPTANQAGSNALSPSGRYTLALRQTAALPAKTVVDAWVARDDTIPGYPQYGRQSWFDDKLYEYRDIYSGRLVQKDNASLVQRQCTINAIATSRSPVVIGGYTRREIEIAGYSAAGARAPRPQPPRWPDAAAPSEDSLALAGRLAAGSHSGVRVAVGGTSVAAPQIARLVADDLAAAGKGDRAFVQDRADHDETTVPGDPPPLPWIPKPPEERAGHGRIWTTPLQKVRRYEY